MSDSDNSSDGIDRDWPDANPTDKQDNLPDSAIVPHVLKLNNLGVRTFQSCSGHVHPDGTRTDGTLWFDAEIDVTPLIECEEISYVKRMYKPEECWEIVFPGLAKNEASLKRAMDAVFHSLQSEDDRNVE